MRKLAPITAALLFALACAEEDKTPPPAPNLDPVETPTAALKLIVSGSAEYGAAVKISGGAAAVETTADSFTARFRAEVALNPDAENTLSVTATDAAGNTSAPATLKIVHATGYGIPSEVSLSLFKNADTAPLADPATIAVGDTVRIEAAVLDKKGNKLDTRVDVATDVPGSLLEGLTLTNLMKAGTFKIVATARDTNVFATARVVIAPGAPFKLTLKASTPETVAGAQVALSPVVTDAAGNEITDAQVTLSLSPALAPQFTLPNTSPAQTVSQGIIGQQFVAYDLSAAQSTNGKFTLTAAVSGTALSSTTEITVRPAAGQRFQSLQYVPSGTTKTVAAGSDVQYTYQVVDLYGNASPTKVVPFTDAPGALFVDDGVSGAGRVTGLTAVGNFTLSFYISGAGLKGTLQLSVGTGPAASLTASAAASLVAPNTDVKAFAQVRDPFGNRILCTAATVSDVAFTATSNGGGSSTPTATACFNGAFEATFRFANEDTWAIDAAYNPGGTASGVKGTVFVTVLSFDNTPPTVTIDPANFRRNGAPCSFTGSPSACVVNPGDFIEFAVTANDNKALSELEYTAFFATAGGSGTLRTRTVLVPSNATLPISQIFSFTVPNAFLEDVPLTALAVDGAGNRATSAQLVLRVTVQTYGGRSAALVARDLGGGFINNPEDVLVAANGDLYVANSGNSNVLKIAAGSTFPTVFVGGAALGGRSPGFLTKDSSGNIYLTDQNGDTRVTQLSPTGAVTTYLNYNNGANLRGLATSPAVPAKAIVTIGAVTDGDQLTVAGTTYEIDVVGTCPNVAAQTVTCVSSGATPAQIATALAGCISAGTGCTAGGNPATAHATVNAAVAATGGTAIVLAARTAGSAGNTLQLTTSACPRFNFNAGGTTCPPPVSTLTEGHDETFFVAQEGGGATISTIFRFPFTFSTGLPRSQTSNEGAFDMFFGGAPHEQWGLLARDLTTASSRNLRDLAFYFPDATIGTNRLRGVRVVDNTQTAIFNSAAVANGRTACADCIRGTNDPAQPSFNFNRLWDVAALPDGCLLVSDDGNGALYSVDARNPATADPLVSLVASGMGNPRGIDLAANGDLYVALNNGNAIIRVSPSASTTDCF